MKTIVLFFVICACASGPNPPPSPKLPGNKIATCESSCDNLRALECPEAEPTEEGATCEDVCRNSVASGYSRIDLACLTRAPSCDLAEEC